MAYRDYRRKGQSHLGSLYIAIYTLKMEFKWNHIYEIIATCKYLDSNILESDIHYNS